MMIVSRKKWEAMEARLKELERLIRHKAPIEFGYGLYEISCFSTEPWYRHHISVVDAIKLLADHAGVEFDHDPGKAPQNTLKPIGAKKK